jgi:release factor glutamine methyltransferase
LRLDLALRQATERLQAASRGDARLDAETLLMHAVGRERSYLYAHPELELSCSDVSRYSAMLDRRAAGEPLQYITGHRQFWGLDLEVNPSVLIPRPETEHLVEAAIELLRTKPMARVIDVGTGSGCIALALAKELPQVEIEAVDISPEALAVARGNAQRLGLERVKCALSDLLEKFLHQDARFDMVVSNPPYVGESEADKLQVEVREHEPHCALFGGEQGLDIYRRLIPQAKQVLTPGGWLAMEIGFSQQAAILDLLSDWKEVRSIADLRGIPRVVVARS